jgi:hypothetical protein
MTAPARAHVLPPAIGIIARSFGKSFTAGSSAAAC